LLVEKRRQMVDMRTAETNRITDQLKQYFPQILDWFDDLSAPLVASFLARWPTLKDLQKEAPETIRAFFYQHGSRSAARIERRLLEIRQATAAVDDAAIVEPAVLVVRTLLDILTALREGIRQFDKAIQQIAESHPDYAIFASFPGAGAAMAPRLLAAFGSQRERYRSASQLQTFSGIAPVIESSGKQHRTHFRWRCPKFLRQTFHEYAAVSIQFCGWAKEFYNLQKAKGKAHHAAVRSLAFKWIRILFRCWQSRQPYQEQLFEAARHARAVPLSRSPRISAITAKASTAPCGKNLQHGMNRIGNVLKSILADC
jgi:transposase